MSFGAAVRLDGDRLAVGTASGVEIYRGNGLAWTEERFVALPDPAESVFTMALNGDTLAAGSPYDDTTGTIQTGAVYVYTLGTDGAAVSQVIEPNPLVEYFHFGSSLALDGKNMAVAASNRIVILALGPDGWSEIQTLVPDTPVPPAALSVALLGDVLAIGASWYPSTDGSQGSAVFVYRNVGGSFVLENRMNPATPDGSFAQPALGDGLLIIASSVYAKSTASWTLETQLPNRPPTLSAIDGSRIAIFGDQGVDLFERAGGAWPKVLTVKPHDVGAYRYWGGPLALRGNILAAGDQGNQGNGGLTGAAYTFTKTSASSSPDCALSSTGPARVAGAGTGCVEPGTGTAKCPYIAPGTSTVAGMTPYGAISFPFAWTDVAEGLGSHTTVELSNVSPRREGTSPKLGFTVSGDVANLQNGRRIQTSFSLDLCARTEAVDGEVTFDETVDGGAGQPPLGGSIAIEHDGWSVKGTFQTDVFCSWGYTH